MASSSFTRTSSAHHVAESDAATSVHQTLVHLMEMVDKYQLGSAELQRDLQGLDHRTGTQQTTVLVLSDSSESKSRYLQAVLGTTLADVGIPASTVACTYLGYGADAETAVTLPHRLTVRLPLKQLPQFLAEKMPSPEQPEQVFVRFPNPALEKGLVVVDSPELTDGIEALAAYRARTDQALEDADACVFVMDAQRACRSNTINFLRASREYLDKFFFLIESADTLGDIAQQRALETVTHSLQQYCGISRPRVELLSLSFTDHRKARVWKERFDTFQQRILEYARVQSQASVVRDLTRLAAEAVSAADAALHGKNTPMLRRARLRTGLKQLTALHQSCERLYFSAHAALADLSESPRRTAFGEPVRMREAVPITDAPGPFPGTHRQTADPGPAGIHFRHRPPGSADVPGRLTKVQDSDRRSSQEEATGQPAMARDATGSREPIAQPRQLWPTSASTSSADTARSAAPTAEARPAPVPPEPLPSAREIQQAAPAAQGVSGTNGVPQPPSPRFAEFTQPAVRRAVPRLVPQPSKAPEPGVAAAPEIGGEAEKAFSGRTSLSSADAEPAPASASVLELTPAPVPAAITGTGPSLATASSPIQPESLMSESSSPLKRKGGTPAQVSEISHSVAVAGDGTEPATQFQPSAEPEPPVFAEVPNGSSSTNTAYGVLPITAPLTSSFLWQPAGHDSSPRSSVAAASDAIRRTSVEPMMESSPAAPVDTAPVGSPHIFDPAGAIRTVSLSPAKEAEPPKQEDFHVAPAIVHPRVTQLRPANRIPSEDDKVSSSPGTSPSRVTRVALGALLATAAAGVFVAVRPMMKRQPAQLQAPYTEGGPAGQHTAAVPANSPAPPQISASQGPMEGISVPPGAPAPAHPGDSDANAGGTPVYYNHYGQKLGSPDTSADLSVAETTAQAGTAQQAVPAKPSPNQYTSPSLDSDATIQGALANWVRTFRSRNIRAQVACYAPHVDAYFTWRNVTPEQVFSDKERAWGKVATIHKYEVTPISIADQGNGRKSMLLQKDWDTTTTSGKAFSGSEIERLVFAQINGEWKIVTEQEVKVLKLRRE